MKTPSKNDLLYEKEYYYNTIKPEVGVIHPVGYSVSFSSKTGGGIYKVISHIQCECGATNEERLWSEPPRKHSENKLWNNHYRWCPKCGKYEILNGIK